MNDKKIAAKRILLFILFAYGLYWVPAGLCDLLGVLQSDAGFYLITAYAMFTPAAGSLLTRFLTKEGMKNSLLRLHFKGNVKYYLLGIFVPLIYSLISAVIAIPALNVTPGRDVLVEAGVSPIGYIAVIFFNIAVSLALFPIFLGEELGWRGYLFPHLKTVMKRPAAFAHAVNNNAAPLITGITLNSEAVLQNFAMGITGVFVVAMFCIAETAHTRKR